MVTGGARSGKSTYAEKLCIDRNDKVAYIATSIPFDEGMKDRIKKHRASRPKEWKTYEIYKDIHESIAEMGKNHDTALLDCVTLLVNNLMFDFDMNWDACSRNEIDTIESNIQKEIDLLIEEIRKTNLYFVFVTNELGMGIVPENRLSRIYRDIAGRINQKIAALSDEVYLTVSGIPLKIKG